MRYIYLFLMIISVHSVMGQANKGKAPEPPATPAAPATPAIVDFCSLIKKDISDDKTSGDYASPYDQHDVPPLRITRNYSTNPEYSFDNFFIIFQMMGDLDNAYTTNDKGEHIEKNESKVVIEFEDKSKIVDDTMKINHDVSEDKSQSLRYVYYPVTDNNYKDFLTKKITKFSLAGYEQIVPVDSTNSFQKYLECIKAARK